MTASEIHARAALLDPFRILGLDLLPLTLGHVRLLESLDCFDARDPGELGLACVACSLPPAQVMPFLRQDGFEKWLRDWRDGLGAWNFIEKRADFADYIQANTELPEILRPMHDGAVPCRVPAVRMIRVRLMSELHVAWDATDSYPFLEALWDLSALDVRHGRCTMLDQTAEDIAAKIEAVDWDAVRARGEEAIAGKAEVAP